MVWARKEMVMSAWMALGQELGILECSLLLVFRLGSLAMVLLK